MSRILCFLLLSITVAGLTFVVAGDEPVVFRSEVSMLRVDAQVVDSGNRAITGLRVTDFVLREEGRPLEIRNFSSENMPVDVLLLLDVSGSMRPHVQRLSSASHQAMEALGKDDRVAIMVFDRATRIRLPFRDRKADVEREMETLLRQETFNGGTDITRALLDAAEYIGRSGRKDARRAIVILTDDQTERNREDESVSRALTRADAVLSALIAPSAMGNRGGRGRAPAPARGGSWPGVGGGPLGGIILGPQRRPNAGRGNGPANGPVNGGSRTTSAGTAEIARASGGDSMPVDDAYALENTLARLRQRYALYFYLPQGVRPGEERGIRVELADAADRRYPGAEVRYRRVYLAPGGSPDSGSEPVTVSRAPVWRAADQNDVPRSRPRGELSTGPRNGPLRVGQDEPESEPKASPPPPAESAPQAPDSTQGGWRVLKPGEKP